jgi:hypothetical protein
MSEKDEIMLNMWGEETFEEGVWACNLSRCLESEVML